MWCVLLIQYNWCPSKTGELGCDTYTSRTQCKDEGRDWSEPFPSRGAPPIVSKAPASRQKAGERPFSLPLDRINPSDTLILNFYPPDLLTIQFVALCYGSLSKLTHMVNVPFIINIFLDFQSVATSTFLKCHLLSILFSTLLLIIYLYYYI